MKPARWVTVALAGLACLAHAAPPCEPERVQTEISPYWESFIPYRDEKGTTRRILFDTAANFNAINPLDFGKELAVPNPFKLERFEAAPLTIFSKDGEAERVSVQLGIQNFYGKILKIRTVPGHSSIDIYDRSCGAAIEDRNLYRPISQIGYFGEKEQKKSGPAHPNLPIVFVRIGGVLAPGWIDTGYRNDPGQDRFIKINRALLARLEAAAVPLEPFPGMTSSDCQGGEQPAQAWRLSGQDLGITDERGGEIIRYPARTIVLMLATDNRCSALSKMEAPTALLDASFPGSWGEFIIDGVSQSVWIRAPGG